MFVTTYRYRILATKLRHFLDLQHRAESLYQTEPGHRVVYLRNTNDRCQWLELHFFADEAAHSASLERWDQDERMTMLWQDFKQTLDPTFPSNVEEFRRFSHDDVQPPPASPLEV